MSPKRSYLWAVSGMAGRAVFQGAYFLLLAWALGPKELGRLAIFSAITSVLAPLSGIGCSEVLLKQASMDPSTMEANLSHAFGIIPFSGLFVALGAAGAGFVFLDMARDWPALILLVAIDVFALRYAEVILAATQAMEAFRINALIMLTLTIAKLAGVLVLTVLPLARTVQGWSLVQAALMLPVTALLCRQVRRQYVKHPVRPGIRWALAREGVWFGLGVSANSAYRDIDKLFLSKSVTSQELGLYATAYRLVDMAFIPLRALLYVAVPRLFKEGAQGGHSRTQILRFLAVSLAMAAAAYLIYGVGMGLFPRLFGPRFNGIAPMGAILGLILFGRSLLNYAAALVLTSLGVRYAFAVQGCAALVTLLLCWAFIPGGGWRAAAWLSVGTDFLFALVYLTLRQRLPGPQEARP